MKKWIALLLALVLVLGLMAACSKDDADKETEQTNAAATGTQGGSSDADPVTNGDLPFEPETLPASDGDLGEEPATYPASDGDMTE